MNKAPDGTPIPGGKPQWLDTLPDPRTVDRTSAEAVITAYVITAGTWDTTVDKTSAYAIQRAAIYLRSDLRKDVEAYDPDTARGQADFIVAAAHSGESKIEVRDIKTEGMAADPSGTAHRIVHYLFQITHRDGTDAPDIVPTDAWVTAAKENGKWGIVSMKSQPTYG